MNEPVITRDSTIILSIDDAAELFDSCVNKDKSIKKEFYDWYLKKESYFIKEGYLALSEARTENIRALTGLAYFNLTNPEIASFKLLDEETKRPFMIFSFHRMANLTLQGVDINITYLDTKTMTRKGRQIPMRPEGLRNFSRITKESSRENTKAYIKKAKLQKAKSREVVRKVWKDGIGGIAEASANVYVVSLYAALFYFSHKKPVIISSDRESVDKPSETVNVPGIYKYTGFVDLSHSIIYVPKLPKRPRDPNKPVQSYERHIGSWIVRGHYRMVNGKLAWVKPHKKGTGELEKRIYGPSKEFIKFASVRLFQVMRKMKAGIVHRPKRVIETPPPAPEQGPRIGFFKRIINFIFRRA